MASGNKSKIWQFEASREMIEFIKETLDVERVDLTGSMQNHALLDALSDVDMDVVFNDSAVFDIKAFISALHVKFGVFGYETFDYSDDKKYLLRVCLDNGWRFDMTFINAEVPGKAQTGDHFIDSLDSTINRFWFISTMVLVKLGRFDNLIASHLALELCQLIIVVRMLIRDNAKGTNIHRFGDKEDVPLLHALRNLKDNGDFSAKDTKNEILSILYTAAQNMDNMPELRDFGYERRSEKLKKIIP